VIRITSWNIGGREVPWRELAADPAIDIALLQEAKAPAADIGMQIVGVEDAWLTSGWERRNFRTAVVRCSDRVEMLADPVVRPLGLAGPNELAVSRAGTLALAKVVPREGQAFTVVSVYSVWERPVPRSEGGWIYADASAHRLISDLSALVASQRGARILVAGDWNILNGYGEGGSAYRGQRYRSVFNRLEVLGFRLVGPRQPDGISASPHPSELPPGSLDVPTYRTDEADPATGQRQLDFVFATEAMADEVTKVQALNRPEEWGPSDHCRVSIEVTPRNARADQEAGSKRSQSVP